MQNRVRRRCNEVDRIVVNLHHFGIGGDAGLQVGAIGAYALSSVIGQLFVYYTITEFDSLVLSTVTTTRKIFSTVYSAFRKPENALNATQWGGCGLVFAALGYELLEKYLRRGKRVKKA